MTMMSMTGFGRSEGTTKDATFCLEMKSVNQKGLDVRVRVPKELSMFEGTIAQVIKAMFARGRIDAALEVQKNSSDDGFVFDEQKAGEAMLAMNAFAKTSGLSTVTFNELLKAPGVFVRAKPEQDLAEIEEQVKALAQKAVEKLRQARAHEGKALSQVVKARVENIEAIVVELTNDSEQSVERIHERLTKRVSALLSEVQLDEARLAQEVAFLADRADIAEELERLRAHTKHFRDVAAKPPCGRKLDFLCQEFLREANTIASKCQHAESAHRVVELKAEIERLREQVQNVE